MKPITVLALFDGMACGLEALKRAGIPVKKYYASEIDQYAIKIASKNHPEIIHLGDVQNWKEWDIDSPDLVIGGSPCQGFSFAGKQLAFNDPKTMRRADSNKEIKIEQHVEFRFDGKSNCLSTVGKDNSDYAR